MIVNGDEFENIEIVPEEKSDKGNNPYIYSSNCKDNNPDMNKNITNTQKCDIIVTGSVDKHGNPPHPLMSLDTDRDVMLDLVKNKGLMRPAMEDKRVSSIDSEMSEASTLVSTNSDSYTADQSKKRSRINHHSIRGFMSDSEMETKGVCNFWLPKACLFYLIPSLLLY